MSESAYETNRMRCKAVIRAELGTAKELGKYLLPGQDEHQAQVRALEWLRGAKPRDPDTFLLWKEWTDRKWRTKGAKDKLQAALKEIISEQTAVTDKVNGIS